MSGNTESQLVELQTQFAFQEDLLAALDARVAAQDREIQQMQTKIEALKSLCRQLVDSLEQQPLGGADSSMQERPPHY
jgi:SlyX protein